MSSSKDLRAKAAASKPKSAAEGMIKTKAGEEEEKPNKTAISLFIEPELYESVKALASYRAAQGERNKQGQPMSAGSVINEAISEYVQARKCELETWRVLMQKIKESAK